MVAALIMWCAALAAAVWKGSQLARMPRDRGLLIVTICTVLVVAALTAQLMVSIPVLAGSFPRQAPVLIEFVLLTLFFALLLGLLRSVRASPTSGARGYVELGVALAVSAALTVIFFGTALTGGANYGDYTETAGPAGVLAFHLIGNLYMAYATAYGACLAWSAAAVSVTPPTRLGLRVAAVGLVICCLGTHLPRVLSTGGRLLLRTSLVPGTSVWTSPLLAIGVGVFFLGVGYPGARTGIAKARMWVEARRHYAQLGPLWTVLYRQFPTIALFPPSGPARERLRLRHMRLRYYRRVIECRDGLVCLSPYMATPVRASDSPARQASLIREALEHEALDRCAPDGHLAAPSVIAPPEGTGMDSDVRAILALSRALDRAERAKAGQSTA
ncbi:MAB_1171c family putative transporter [Sciscionella marina]|uniref:MAB_1171c family putative transporter n=1 Tax=Sciscionella marina TaxID=508770 RepID=UPI000372A368|nr:MAB_1171c family putative transporter [Sciscionella marina]